MLATCFPELHLKVPANVSYAPYRGYWKDMKNQQNFVEEIATKLGITSPKDWYSVTKEQFAKAGGSSLLIYHNNSLIKLLQSVYPHRSWIAYRFSQPHNVPQGIKTYSKYQYLLYKYVKSVSSRRVDRLQERYFRIN